MKKIFTLSLLAASMLFSSISFGQEKTKSSKPKKNVASTVAKKDKQLGVSAQQDDSKKKEQQDTTKSNGTRMAISNKGVPTKGQTKKAASTATDGGKTENKTKTETEKK